MNKHQHLLAYRLARDLVATQPLLTGIFLFVLVAMSVLVISGPMEKVAILKWCAHLLTFEFSVLFVSTLHNSKWLRVQHMLPISNATIVSIPLLFISLPVLWSILFFCGFRLVYVGVSSVNVRALWDLLPFVPESFAAGGQSVMLFVLLQITAAGLPYLIFLFLHSRLSRYNRAIGRTMAIAQAVVCLTLVVWGLLMDQFTLAAVSGILVVEPMARFRRNYWRGNRSTSDFGKMHFYFIRKIAGRWVYHPKALVLLMFLLVASLFLAALAYKITGNAIPDLAFIGLAVYLFWSQAVTLLMRREPLLVHGTLPARPWRVLFFQFWPLILIHLIIGPIATYVFLHTLAIPAILTASAFAASLGILVYVGAMAILGKDASVIAAIVAGVTIAAWWGLMLIRLSEHALTTDHQIHLQPIDGAVAITLITVAVISVPATLCILHRRLAQNRIGDSPIMFLWRAEQ